MSNLSRQITLTFCWRAHDITLLSGLVVPWAVTPLCQALSNFWQHELFCLMHAVCIFHNGSLPGRGTTNFRYVRWGCYLPTIPKQRIAKFSALFCSQGRAYRIWCKNLTEREHLEEPSIGGRIMVTWVIKKDNGRACNGLICLVNSVMNLYVA